jgi:hypothetical protein
MKLEGDLLFEEMNKTFNWKITDFLVKIQNTPLMFNNFSMLDDKNEDFWTYLKLYKEKIKFGLLKINDRSSDFYVSMSTSSILDKKYQKKFKGDTIGELDFSRLSMTKLNVLDLNHLKENAATLLPGGALTIHFEIKIHSSKPQQAFQSHRNSCVNDLNEAFINMNNTDCVIHCGEGQKLDCHSFMLEARSPVFKAMLSSGFQVSLL